MSPERPLGPADGATCGPAPTREGQSKPTRPNCRRLAHSTTPFSLYCGAKITTLGDARPCLSGVARRRRAMTDSAGTIEFDANPRTLVPVGLMMIALTGVSAL